MIYQDIEYITKRITQILSEQRTDLTGNLQHIVESFLKRRADFLSIAEQIQGPCYILDQRELHHALSSYREAFARHLPGSRHFYAMKVNHQEDLLKECIKAGFGVDVSSGRELEIALQQGATHIVFSGPGKQIDELRLALRETQRVIVNIDSFRELEKLGTLLDDSPESLRAGVRVYTSLHGTWSKFGIALSQLREFWQKAAAYPKLRLCGIQMHISWNADAQPYCGMLRELANYLASEFTPEMRREIEFIDIGGGFRPYLSEGYYHWKTPAGAIIKAVDSAFGEYTEFTYYLTSAIPIEQYAAEIAACIRQELDPLVRCEYYTEPGRIICNNAMHIMLRVLDKKTPDSAILDGGINMLGWERFEHDYFPVINLTHPSAENEIRFRLYGPLCMPQDMWGYYIYAHTVEEGDLILVPYQGALTFSLAQSFIKPIPPVVVMPAK